MVKIRSGETKEILFTKSNLNLISTVEDHCVSDDTDRLTRNECLIKLVSELKHPFFWIHIHEFQHYSNFICRLKIFSSTNIIALYLSHLMDYISFVLFLMRAEIVHLQQWYLKPLRAYLRRAMNLCVQMSPNVRGPITF